MTQSTFELVQYYQNLLILRYIGKPRAYATIGAQVAPVIMPQTTVETIAFPEIPTSGTFQISYNGSVSPAINWNDSAATVQSKLRELSLDSIDGGNAFSTYTNFIDGGDAFTTVFMEDIDGGNAFGFGLGSIVVTGSIAAGLLTVTFDGVTPPAALLVLESNSLLDADGNPVVPVIAETDLTLPLAVQAGFNLTGPSPAVGKQLDVLGKYAGVTRTGNGFTQPITLNDSDFLAFIKMAIITNSAGSSLAEIQKLLAQFFPGGQILVFDYQNMQMSYLISTSIGSLDLVELFVTEGLLPKPMGVELALVIYAPDITKFFGFRTYDTPAFNSTPFNDYTDYHMDWPWLSYADAI